MKLYRLLPDFVDGADMRMIERAAAFASLTSVSWLFTRE